MARMSKRISNKINKTKEKKNAHKEKNNFLCLPHTNSKTNI